MDTQERFACNVYDTLFIGRTLTQVHDMIQTYEEERPNMRLSTYVIKPCIEERISSTRIRLRFQGEA